ncbi:hypothetical protein [Nevskia ramosa]|uniref:hypothetical protein n=1 Tax=Nevskia ramosa TaxID=64002 RepID=UPI003D149F1E
MAKLTRGLGNLAQRSESFGTVSTEPFGTRHSELHAGTAANDSLQKPAGTGRPPVLTDEQLAELARNLNTRLGRPPKAEELIAETGGCQRKRALTAIQTLRQELAVRSVRSQLMFPAAIETQLRGLVAEWLNLAAEHLAQRQAEFSELQEERAASAAAHVEELQSRIIDIGAAASSMRQRYDEQVAQIRQLTQDCEQARTQRDALQVIAHERQRVIDQLVLGPATVAASMETA